MFLKIFPSRPEHTNFHPYENNDFMRVKENMSLGRQSIENHRIIEFNIPYVNVCTTSEYTPAPFNAINMLTLPLTSIQIRLLRR